MCFLSNVSGCPRIGTFLTTFIATNWNLSCPKISALLTNLIAKNWNHGCPRIAPFLSTFFNPFLSTGTLMSDLFVFHISFYAQRAIVLKSLRSLYRLRPYSRFLVFSFSWGFLWIFSSSSSFFFDDIKRTNLQTFFIHEKNCDKKNYKKLILKMAFNHNITINVS